LAPTSADSFATGLGIGSSEWIMVRAGKQHHRRDDLSNGAVASESWPAAPFTISLIKLK
jgi:hypothetical protein